MRIYREEVNGHPGESANWRIEILLFNGVRQPRNYLLATC